MLARTERQALAALMTVAIMAQLVGHLSCCLMHMKAANGAGNPFATIVLCTSDGPRTVPAPDAPAPAPACDCALLCAATLALIAAFVWLLALFGVCRLKLAAGGPPPLARLPRLGFRGRAPPFSV